VAGNPCGSRCLVLHTDCLKKALFVGPQVAVGQAFWLVACHASSVLTVRLSDTPQRLPIAPFMTVLTSILSLPRSPPETMEDPEETWLRLPLTKPADHCSETTEPHRRSACADGHNPVMGRPGFCDRPLHVASEIERGRAVRNCPPPPWLPEGRCEPEPSPAAQTKQCRLMPKPSGTSPSVPHRTWLVPRTRAS
jgi:hypothetical protein